MMELYIIVNYPRVKKFTEIFDLGLRIKIQDIFLITQFSVIKKFVLYPVSYNYGLFFKWSKKLLFNLYE